MADLALKILAGGFFSMLVVIAIDIHESTRR